MMDYHSLNTTVLKTVGQSCYSLDSVIELLTKIKKLGRLCQGGEQSPNAEECYDAIKYLQLLKSLDFLFVSI